MNNLNEATDMVNLVTNFLNAFSAMFTSLGSALIAFGVVWSVVVTACSALATKMPKPNESAPVSYLLVYRAVNLIAFNYGNAENKEK
jgi:hypothetical protein